MIRPAVAGEEDGRGRARRASAFAKGYGVIRPAVAGEEDRDFGLWIGGVDGIGEIADCGVWRKKRLESGGLMIWVLGSNSSFYPEGWLRLAGLVMVMISRRSANFYLRSSPRLARRGLHQLDGGAVGVAHVNNAFAGVGTGLERLGFAGRVSNPPPPSF